MPYVNKPRPYKKEYQQQLSRGEGDERLQRQQARSAVDAKGINRKGKDIAHVKALSKGGSNGDGLMLQTATQNRGFKRNSDGSMKNPVDKSGRGRKIKV